MRHVVYSDRAVHPDDSAERSARKQGQGHYDGQALSDLISEIRTYQVEDDVTGHDPVSEIVDSSVSELGYTPTRADAVFNAVFECQSVGSDSYRGAVERDCARGGYVSHELLASDGSSGNDLKYEVSVDSPSVYFATNSGQVNSEPDPDFVLHLVGGFPYISMDDIIDLPIPFSRGSFTASYESNNSRYCFTYRVNIAKLAELGYPSSTLDGMVQALKGDALSLFTQWSIVYPLSGYSVLMVSPETNRSYPGSGYTADRVMYRSKSAEQNTIIHISADGTTTETGSTAACPYDVMNIIPGSDIRIDIRDYENNQTSTAAGRALEFDLMFYFPDSVISSLGWGWSSDDLDSVASDYNHRMFYINKTLQATMDEDSLGTSSPYHRPLTEIINRFSFTSGYNHIYLVFNPTWSVELFAAGYMFNPDTFCAFKYSDKIPMKLSNISEESEDTCYVGKYVETNDVNNQCLLSLLGSAAVSEEVQIDVYPWESLYLVSTSTTEISCDTYDATLVDDSIDITVCWPGHPDSNSINLSSAKLYRLSPKAGSAIPTSCEVTFGSLPVPDVAFYARNGRGYQPLFLLRSTPSNPPTISNNELLVGWGYSDAPMTSLSLTDLSLGTYIYYPSGQSPAARTVYVDIYGVVNGVEQLLEQASSSSGNPVNWLYTATTTGEQIYASNSFSSVVNAVRIPETVPAGTTEIVIEITLQ